MLEFKFTILTPWTLLSSDLPEELCEDKPAIEFSRILCERSLEELDRYSFWPRARGEAFIRKSFDSFEERFLRQSEYAVIVLSGRHVSCLDNIYPRFLVFLTIRPSWAERLLLVFLGEPEGSYRFDTKILTHAPIVFNGSMEDAWASDQESWTKLLGVLRKKYLPQSTENLHVKPQTSAPVHNYEPKWLSVTDVRGRPLAVRITEQATQVNSGPASWHDLSRRTHDIWSNHSGPYSTNSCHSPWNQSATRLTPSNQRFRTGSYCLSDSATSFDLLHGRSSSVPPAPHPPFGRDSPHGFGSNSSFQHSSNISPYLRRSVDSKHPRRDSENQSVIEEQEEELNLSASLCEHTAPLAVTDERVFDQYQNPELMCLPKSTLRIHIHQGNPHEPSTSQSSHAPHENPTRSEHKTFFSRIRGKRNAQSLKEKTFNHHERGEENKRVVRRLKGFWKSHHKSETFIARSRDALGGTLKSLADFSTNILAVDPALDVKSIDKLQARSCPNIRDIRGIRSRPLSPHANRITSSDFERSRDSLDPLSCSPALNTYHRGVSTLGDDHFSNAARGYMGPVITLQQPVEQHETHSTAAQTDLTLPYESDRISVSNLSAVRPDSGRGSMSPVPTDLSVETSSRTWLTSTGPNSPNGTYACRAESRAKSESEFVPTCDIWSNRTHTKSLTPIPPMIMSVASNDQLFPYQDESEARLNAEITTPDNRLPPTLLDDQSGAPDSQHSAKPGDELTFTEFGVSADKGIEVVTSITSITTPMVSSDSPRVQGSRPDYAHFPEETSLQVTLADLGRTVKPPSPSTVLHAPTGDGNADSVKGKCDLTEQNAEVDQQPQLSIAQNIQDIASNTSQSFGSSNPTASDRLSNTADQNVSATLGTELTNNQSRSVDQEKTEVNQIVLETDVDGDVDEIHQCSSSLAHVHSNNANVSQDPTGALFGQPEILDNEYEAEASLVDVPDISSVTSPTECRHRGSIDVTSDVVSDIPSDWNEANTDHKVSYAQADDITIDMSISENGHVPEQQTLMEISQLDSGVDAEMNETDQLASDTSEATTLDAVHPSDEAVHVKKEQNCSFLTSSTAIEIPSSDANLTNVPIEDIIVSSNQLQPQGRSEGMNVPFTDQIVSAQESVGGSLDSEVRSSVENVCKDASQSDSKLNDEYELRAQSMSVRTVPPDVSSNSIKPETAVLFESANLDDMGLNADSQNQIYTIEHSVTDDTQAHLSEQPSHRVIGNESSSASFMESIQNQTEEVGQIPGSNESPNETWTGWFARKLFRRRDSSLPSEANLRNSMEIEELKRDIEKSQETSRTPEVLPGPNVNQTFEENAETIAHNDTNDYDSIATDLIPQQGTRVPVISNGFSDATADRLSIDLDANHEQVVASRGDKSQHSYHDQDINKNVDLVEAQSPELGLGGIASEQQHAVRSENPVSEPILSDKLPLSYNTVPEAQPNQLYGQYSDSVSRTIAQDAEDTTSLSPDARGALSNNISERDMLNPMKSQNEAVGTETLQNSQWRSSETTISNCQSASSNGEIENVETGQLSTGHDSRSQSQNSTERNPEGQETLDEHNGRISLVDQMALESESSIDRPLPDQIHLHSDDRPEEGNLLNGQMIPMGSVEVTRPSEWSFVVVTSVFHFVTIYIPRHTYWFYSATFGSREELFEAMAERGIRLAISWERIVAGLRNPYYVGVVFVCITSAAPYLSQWPELVGRLLNVTEWYLFTPPFWVDRPILHHFGQIVHSVHRHLIWPGQTVITSFRRYPWALVNPPEQQ